MSRRIFTLLLALLLLLPAAVRAEKMLFEDENGVAIEEDAERPAAQDGPVEETFTLRPAATPAPTGTPFALLQYGSSGDAVLAAQERLTALGYYFGKCSGDFLEGTQSAVRRFQRYNGMKETGKLDEATWDRLFSAAAVHRDGSTPYATPSPVPELTPTPSPTPFVYKRKLQYGDQSDLVSALQARLAELGYYEAKVSGG